MSINCVNPYIQFKIHINFHILRISIQKLTYTVIPCVLPEQFVGKFCLLLTRNNLKSDLLSSCWPAHGLYCVLIDFQLNYFVTVITNFMREYIFLCMYRIQRRSIRFYSSWLSIKLNKLKVYMIDTRIKHTWQFLIDWSL